MMSKHNKSSVIYPQGKYTHDAKKAIENSTLTAGQRALVSWVIDQPPERISVGAIRHACGFGEKKWITVRDQLVHLGILQQVFKVMPNRSKCWHLNFYLQPIFQQAEKKGGDHVRARVIPAKWGDHART
jgi:hypothetical protein